MKRRGLLKRAGAGAHAGSNALAEQLAPAFGPKVRVNATGADPFLTDISQAWPAGTVQPLSAAAV